MNFDETFKVNDPDLTIKIKRISPGEGLYKSFKLLPIENSAFFHFGNKITKDPLILLDTALHDDIGQRQIKTPSPGSKEVLLFSSFKSLMYRQYTRVLYDK